MAESIIELRRFRGIANTTDLVRIPSEYMSVATNVDIDDEYMLHMRYGYSKVFDGNCHSLWNTKDRRLMFYVDNGTLKMVTSEHTIHTLMTGLRHDLKMSYVEFGDMVIFSNSNIDGYVRNGVCSLFPEVSERYKTKMRGGRIMCVYNSRLYSVVDDTIIYSDPASPFVMDERTYAIPLVGPITMMVPVSTGLYVSHNNTVAFLHGSDPSEFVYTKINNSPAIPGMSILVEGEDVGRGITGCVAMWWAEDGMFIGTSDGVVKNITNGLYVLGNPIDGTMIYRDDLAFSQLLCTYRSKL